MSDRPNFDTQVSQLKHRLAKLREMTRILALMADDIGVASQFTRALDEIDENVFKIEWTYGILDEDGVTYEYRALPLGDVVQTDPYLDPLKIPLLERGVVRRQVGPWRTHTADPKAQAISALARAHHGFRGSSSSALQQAEHLHARLDSEGWELRRKDAS